MLHYWKMNIGPGFWRSIVLSSPLTVAILKPFDETAEVRGPVPSCALVLFGGGLVEEDDEHSIVACRHVGGGGSTDGCGGEELQ
ncbi:hypothetical protein F0562_022890 [Nyssa sinensis]|uniref:Uncharacterized protein n=1 Tax=Nyssa sinensis TaxID=561372 RepID=A0A5J5BGI8_9ASTE|nr:hypothetical protein F0562_022890 [Nyssa sinensis]